MYTNKKNMKSQLILILVAAFVLPQVLLAQYNEPTYDRKPAYSYEEAVSENESLVSTFEVYPSRTDGELNIVMDDFVGQSVEILIQDKKGNTVIHQTIEHLHVGYQWLDLNDFDLENGKYKVTVLNNGITFNAETVFTRKK